MIVGTLLVTSIRVDDYLYQRRRSSFDSRGTFGYVDAICDHTCCSSRPLISPCSSRDSSSLPCCHTLSRCPRRRNTNHDVSKDFLGRRLKAAVVSRKVSVPFSEAMITAPEALPVAGASVAPLYLSLTVDGAIGQRLCLSNRFSGQRGSRWSSLPTHPPPLPVHLTAASSPTSHDTYHASPVPTSAGTRTTAPSTAPPNLRTRPVVTERKVHD